MTYASPQLAHRILRHFRKCTVSRAASSSNRSRAKDPFAKATALARVLSDRREQRGCFSRTWAPPREKTYQRQARR